MKDEMNGNYTGNELSRAVKLRAAMLGVTDIVCDRNSHIKIPILWDPGDGYMIHLTAFSGANGGFQDHVILSFF